MTTTSVSDDSFEADVLKSDRPVLVDFWAEWCSPCKAIAPLLEELAGEMQGKVIVAKMNIEENPLTPQKYGVKGIPTLMLFKDGQVAGTKVGIGGNMTSNDLANWVGEVIGIAA